LALATGLLLLLAAWAALAWFPSRRFPAPLDDQPAADAAAVANDAATEPEYVGLKVCAECHAEEFRSYQTTAHSQALADLDPDKEPADVQFDHPLSGYSYRVYRADGAFRQRQWLAENDDAEMIQDFPVKYLIGSGRHTRSYLIEDDGFLVESPVTWYESRKAWGMSPGYDRKHHMGFERAADMGCLACHVGRAETVGGALNRIAIHEQAIGCESCHGPGSSHVAARRAAKQSSPARDGAEPLDAIVHPGKLSRDLSESICAQCHLRSDATVFLSKLSAADFRPGRRLSEYRIDYRLDSADSEMKVVGHVEQMRMSRCYQQSDSLSCTTCHNPHAIVAPEQAAARYRGKCLECHASADCGLEADRRAKTEPADNCTACHMPQTPTDIPHIAFTHHRIGIHRAAPEATAAKQERAEEGFGELAPLSDVSHLTEIERDRCLGLAYLEYGQKQERGAMQHYRRRAVELLEKVHSQAVRDANVDAALARVYWSESPPRAARLALETLEDDPLPPNERTNALFVLADIAFRSRQWASAQSSLEQLVRLRRHPVDWMLLGLSQAALGDESTAIKSLRRAAEINPYLPDVHEQLARLYERRGQKELAERQRRLAQLLKGREKERTGDK
jgi:predicted CXXCH cytochrome family protein